jgi:RND family efflux transporter MFP subunit
MAAFHGKEPVPVRVDINGNPDHPQTGHLVFVDNQVDSATGTLGLRARFDNPDHLLWPGQFVTVTLVVAHHPNTVVVPSQAVQVNQEGTYVFVVDADNTAQMQQVKTGADMGHMTAILSGLKPDQTVVTDGMELRLFPGAKVAIKSSLQAAVNEVIDGGPAAGATSAPAGASAAPAEKARTGAAPSEVK